MAIFKDSRYENVPVYKQYNDETALNYRKSAPSLIPTLRRRSLTTFYLNEAITHLFQQGDRVDLLAYKYYGDAQKWWIILDANPQYMTPWEIPIGARLLIPPANALVGGALE